MRSLTLVATLIGCLLLAPTAGAASSWRWPVEGRVITPYRNGEDPYAGGQHRGIDIAAPVGTRVVAASAGTVTFAGVAGSSGLTVSIRTDDGAFDTAYLHLGSAAVRRGDHLAAGDPLGTVGTSGRRSAVEPHLHFGVREAGTRFAYRDPLDFLPVAPPAGAPPRVTPLPVGAPVAARPQPMWLAPAPRPEAGGAPVPAGAAPVRALHGLSALAPAASLMAASARAPGDTHALGAARSQAHSGTASHTASLRSQTADAVAQHSTHERTGTHPRGANAAAGSNPTATAGAHSRTAPLPAVGPPDHARSGAARLATAHPHHGRATPDGGPDLDLGWLAACLGMVAVATLLGRPRAATRSLRRAFSPEVSRQ
ncbi:MAG: hypothetical protein QOH38_1984 [Thermoleophilaceae bacterium]|nr:hypothetical protein [Thermoleophilaceae bacterium]